MERAQKFRELEQSKLGVCASIPKQIHQSWEHQRGKITFFNSKYIKNRRFLPLPPQSPERPPLLIEGDPLSIMETLYLIIKEDIDKTVKFSRNHWRLTFRGIVDEYEPERKK